MFVNVQGRHLERIVAYKVESFIARVILFTPIHKVAFFE